MTDPARPVEPLPAEFASVDHPQLQEPVRGLRSLVVAALLALLLLSVGVDAFLFIQDHFVRRDLQGLAAAKEAIREFEARKRPLSNSFVSQLQIYAQTHSDFRPILDKYGIKTPEAPAAPGAAPGATNAGK